MFKSQCEQFVLSVITSIFLARLEGGFDFLRFEISFDEYLFTAYFGSPDSWVREHLARLMAFQRSEIYKVRG